MSTSAARFFSRASARAIAEFEKLIPVALFSAIGLLISVSIVVLDTYLPGEWF